MGGEIDLATAPRLREILEGVVRQGGREVVIDLSEVAFIDSTGLGVLLGCLRRLKERNGELTLVGLRAPVERVFTITGLDRVFTIRGVDGAKRG